MLSYDFVDCYYLGDRIFGIVHTYMCVKDIQHRNRKSEARSDKYVGLSIFAAILSPCAEIPRNLDKFVEVKIEKAFRRMFQLASIKNAVNIISNGFGQSSYFENISITNAYAHCICLVSCRLLAR